MNAPEKVSKKQNTASHFRKLVLSVIAVVVLLAMALDTKIVRIGSSEDTRAKAFSAEAYGKEQFPKIQAWIEKASVDAKTLAEAIGTDSTAAGEKYGKPGSVGPIFPVKFSGVVGEGSSGIFKIKVDDFPEGIGIRVQMGPAINGTEVRDASGTISFGQFTNQIEYQDAGAALNDEIKATVLGNLDRENLPGKQVEIIGVFQLINPANWLITPIRLKVVP